MRHKKVISILKLILAAAVIMNFNSPLMAKGDIYAVGCLDNYPYEYINNAGMPAGFSVELINSIADELKLNCRIELVPYDRYIYLKQNPDVDLILGMIRGDEDREYKFFRTGLEIHFSIYANSDSILSSINDLHDSKIIIAAHSLISNPIMKELNKSLKLKPILSYDETTALTLLTKNECEAVFISGTSARKIIKNMNITGINEIPVSPGFFDYGFGVRKNKNVFYDNLQTGYNKINENGQYRKIYNKWFDEKSYKSFLSGRGIYVSAGILSFVIFIIFMIINSFVLRRRIKEKTESLNLSLIDLNKIQVQLKESEKRFKRIFNKSPSGLMILNSAGRVLLFNEAIVNIFGVNNPDEIPDLDVLNSPVSTDWFKSRLKNYHTINIEIKFNFEIIRETGYYSTNKSGIMILELIINPVEINSGSPESGYICQFSDNTNERVLIEEIKFNQRKLEIVFEAVKDGLWEWNLLSGKVRYNRKFFSFLGYKMESYPDDISTLFNFIHDDDRESVKNELIDKVLNGRSFSIDYRMVMSNGKIVNVRSRGEAIEWDDNLKPMRIIGIQAEMQFHHNIYKRINLFKNDLNNTDNNALQRNDNNILRGRTILIVDDNYLIYLHLSELFKKYNASSIYASSGIEAIDIVKNRYDLNLILIDKYMPELDGVQTLKEIRRIDKNIPVVIQTGELSDAIYSDFIREGFNGAIGKPIEENLLIETISGILETGFYK